MAIRVPVIAEADVLVLGGTLPAVSLARALARSGRSVFLATPLAYLGEDVCGTLDFDIAGGSPERAAAYRDVVGGVAPVAPAAVKAAADAALADAGVRFLFQLHPVLPAYDAHGRVAGVLFADRSGFHAVAANVVVDATERASTARLCGVPFTPFSPGRKALRAHVIGGASDGGGTLRVTRLPMVAPSSPERPVFLVEGEYTFSAPEPFSAARAVNAFRLAFFSPDAVYAPDLVEVDWGDGPAAGFAPSPELPVFAGVPRGGAADVEALLAAIGPGAPAPVRFGRECARTLPGGVEVVRLDETRLFAGAPRLSFDPEALPPLGGRADEVDALVVGGGTGGAPAAIAAARAGASTVLAESLSRLGGLMTLGRIGKYWFGRQVGFAKEGDRAVYATGDDPVNNDGHWGFNGDWRARWFLDEACGARSDVLFRATACAALVRRGAGAPRVCGAVFATPFGAGWLLARSCIDATGNADLAAQAGAVALDTLSEEPAVQGAGLSPVELGRSYTNNDCTFVLDGDVADSTRAFVAAHAKFANSAFDAAPILGTRERRRIRGDVVLHPVDFFAGRTWRDTMAVAKSNFDTHGYTLSPLFLVRPPTKDPREADVPLRALLPKGLDGILVTGLAISADRDAMPLVRMQADVQNQGYAAGLVAAASAAAGGLPLRDVPLRPVQRALVDAQCLPERVLSDADRFPEVPGDDPCARAARCFAEPEAAKPGLLRRLAQGGGDAIEAAQTLAFLGDASGRDVLVASLLAEPFDKGWNYTGMGQFGASASVQDTSLLALRAIGGGAEAVLAKARELTPESEFSHVRATCLCLLREPDARAAAPLAALLAAPGASGHAVRTMAGAIASVRPEWNDTSERNAQLRELYLAAALLAMEPSNPAARASLESYRDGLQGAFAPFAAAALRAARAP